MHTINDVDFTIPVSQWIYQGRSPAHGAVRLTGITIGGGRFFRPDPKMMPVCVRSCTCRKLETTVGEVNQQALIER